MVPTKIQPIKSKIINSLKYVSHNERDKSQFQCLISGIKIIYKHVFVNYEIRMSAKQIKLVSEIYNGLMGSIERFIWVPLNTGSDKKIWPGFHFTSS